MKTLVTIIFLAFIFTGCSEKPNEKPSTVLQDYLGDKRFEAVNVDTDNDGQGDKKYSELEILLSQNVCKKIIWKDISVETENNIDAYKASMKCFLSDEINAQYKDYALRYMPKYRSKYTSSIEHHEIELSYSINKQSLEYHTQTINRIKKNLKLFDKDYSFIKNTDIPKLYITYEATIFLEGNNYVTAYNKPYVLLKKQLFIDINNRKLTTTDVRTGNIIKKIPQSEYNKENIFDRIMNFDDNFNLIHYLYLNK